MLKKKLNFCLILFFFINNIFSQNIRVDARFDSTQILIGDQIYLSVTVEQPRNIKVELPNFRDSLAGKIEILKILPNDTIPLSNNTIRIIQRYLITSFDSGVYKVGPIKFPYHTGATTDTIISDPVILTVNTIPVNDVTKIADIKKIIELPLTLKEILLYLGIVFVILLLIAFGIYAYLRWKNKKPLFAFLEKPVEPAHVIAFRELEKLKQEKLWQQGFVKEYHSRLTDIIRTYIEHRFLFPAMESTTTEIYQNLRNVNDIDTQIIDKLNEMLQLADLAKFAKYEPLPDEHDKSWHIAYEFVEKTFIKPIETTNETTNEVTKSNS